MPGLQVTFKGIAIDNPHLCTFTIRNSGNVPIKKDDYEQPITVGFVPGAQHPRFPVRIVAFEPAGKDPESLRPSVTLSQEGTMIFEPMLLNPGDSVTLRVLLDQCFDRERVDVNARIVGVGRVTIETLPRFPMKSFVAGVGLTVAGMISFVYNEQILAYPWFALGFILATWSEAQYKFNEERKRRLGLPE